MFSFILLAINNKKQNFTWILLSESMYAVLIELIFLFSLYPSQCCSHIPFSLPQMSVLQWYVAESYSAWTLCFPNSYRSSLVFASVLSFLSSLLSFCMGSMLMRSIAVSMDVLGKEHLKRHAAFTCYDVVINKVMSKWNSSLDWVYLSVFKCIQNLNGQTEIINMISVKNKIKYF